MTPKLRELIKEYEDLGLGTYLCFMSSDELCVSVERIMEQIARSTRPWDPEIVDNVRYRTLVDQVSQTRNFKPEDLSEGLRAISIMSRIHSEILLAILDKSRQLEQQE